MTCSAYGNYPLNIHWNEIFGNYVDKQVTIEEDIKKRKYKKKVGLPLLLVVRYFMSKYIR